MIISLCVCDVCVYNVKSLNNTAFILIQILSFFLSLWIEYKMKTKFSRSRSINAKFKRIREVI